MVSIIALVDHPKAGKSFFADRLHSEFNAAVTSGSDILREAAAMLPPNVRPRLETRQDYDAFHREWRQRNSLCSIGEIVYGRYLQDTSRITCLEGLRNRYDAGFYK